jgi:type II secretory pathway pseudopilin PulG
MGFSENARASARGDSGVTLIELMIAVAVLATAIVALIGVIITSSRAKAFAEEQCRAQVAAQEKMTEIRSRTYADIEKIYNTSTADDPAGAWAESPWDYADPVTGSARSYAHNMFTVDGLRPPQDVPTQSEPHGEVTVATGADGEYTVTVTIRWRSYVTGRNEQTTLDATLVNRHPVGGGS